MQEQKDAAGEQGQGSGGAASLESVAGAAEIINKLKVRSHRVSSLILLLVGKPRPKMQLPSHAHVQAHSELKDLGVSKLLTR